MNRSDIKFKSSQVKSPLPADTFIAPRTRPELYPGNRPEWSFVLAHGMVYPIVIDQNYEVSPDSILMVQRENKGRTLLDNALKKWSVAPLSQRFAVIGYGSNPVPGQLQSKFGDEAIVPVLYGSLKDTEIVYNLISNQGYAFAELLLHQTDVKAPIAITFLDSMQLQRMIETEENYVLSFAPGPLTLNNGIDIPGGVDDRLYVFAGFRKVWVPKNWKQPVAVKELPSKNRSVDQLGQTQVLQLCIKDFELEEFGIHNPMELIARVRQEANWPDSPPKIKAMIQEHVEKNPSSFPSLSSQLMQLESLKLLKPLFG